MQEPEGNLLKGMGLGDFVMNHALVLGNMFFILGNRACYEKKCGNEGI